MNLRLLAFVLGEIAVIIGALMSIPLFMAIGYGEDTTILAFGIAIGVCLLMGVIGIIVRPPKAKRDMRSTSGFAMCALFWIFIAARKCHSFPCIRIYSQLHRCSF